MDCSPPGSSVHGIIQARILEWVAVYFSKECLNYRTIALISHTTKVMLKILQAIYVCFIDYAKAFDCVDHNKL